MEVRWRIFEAIARGSISVTALIDDEANPVRAGDLIDDKFRIERVIGRGAIGLIAEATHLALSERVAIKFLHPRECGQKEQVTRFQREARAAVRLKSEHVARVYDVGVMPNGNPYMVMEYLSGSDLENHIAEHGPILDPAIACLYMIQACEALAEAHALGIVHRDIKPANLFLYSPPGALPMIKLLDFGISKAALTGEYTDVILADTKTTAIMGTPFYMSPEQIQSTKDVDGRADIWSLGAVMFEALSGQTMWRSSELGALVQEILHKEPVSLRALRPDLPEGLCRVLQKAFAHSPEDRYQTAAAFARALLPYAPPTALVHVERADRFAPEPRRSVPTAPTTAPKAFATTTAATTTTAGSDSVDTEPPPALTPPPLRPPASPGEPRSRSKLPLSFWAGLAGLGALGVITAMVAPPLIGRAGAPAQARIVQPLPTSPSSAPSATASLAVSSPSDVPRSDPTPASTSASAPLPKSRPVTTPVAPRPSTTTTPPTAVKPPPSETPPAATKPALDDDPWRKQTKRKLDDL